MAAYILNLADLALTIYALSRGGVELNPLMQDADFRVVYKVFIVGGLCWWLSKQDKPLARWGLRLCTCAFAAACINNLIFIFGGA